MQELLAAATNFIVLGFTTLFLVDLAIALRNCWVAAGHEVSLPREKEARATQPRTSTPVLPDPWVLPVDEPVAIATSPQQQLTQPLLLLPPAALPQPEATTQPTLTIWVDVDLDTLPLRPARKIAKALGIAQKINGRDQPLSFLRAQIKARLQQPQEVPAEALQALRELAS